MDDTITLRHLGPDDLNILLAVKEGLFDNPVRAEQAAAFLADPLHEMVLALENGCVVGMASGQVMLHPDKPPAFYIGEVGVRDAFQRRGIATLLCVALRSIAKDHGCSGTWLATDDDNQAARGLYRAMNADETKDVVIYDWEDAEIGRYGGS